MKKLLLGILFVWGLTTLSTAQNQYMRYWLGAGVSKKVNKKINVEGLVQTRYNQSSNTIYRNFLQAGATYKVLDFYKTGLKYRYSFTPYESSHRIMFDNFAIHKINKEQFDIRLRLQREIFKNHLTEDRVRVRFRYKHKFDKRLSVYAAAEYFYTSTFKYSNINLQRYTVGSKIRLQLKHFVTVFYRFESKFNVENPNQRFVLGANYSFEF